MNDQEIIDKALEILRSRVSENPVTISSTNDVTDYLTIMLSGQEREVFAVVLLDTRHSVIEYKELFFGSISQAHIHPREVLKAALYANAAAIIFSHNHPSGIAEPSQADINMTRKLADLLSQIDVRVLDHIVIGGGRAVSFAGRGLL